MRIIRNDIIAIGVMVVGHDQDHYQEHMIERI